jgi:hypothetical protein
VGTRIDLEKYGKSSTHRVSIPVPSSSYPVAIPTEVPGPLIYKSFFVTMTGKIQINVLVVTLCILKGT